ncbi:MAG: hypothetical protein K6G13_04765 [Agathobacter sp.]|uniref:type II secretion system F family protein n=1 Tax=Agathobacter sp. TaxID=2021311 RepID=UPI002590BFA3|nr:hypothetical protein [Agathobacter sp.]MCR5677324.1 hypothetical protein [Agathobacter sp.]
MGGRIIKTDTKRFETILAIICAAGALAVCGFLLYDSMWLPIVTPVATYPVYKVIHGYFEQRRKRQLQEDFLIVIASVVSDLRAGISMENAWKEACIVLRQAYPDRKRPGIMQEEINAISRSLELNIPIEQLLLEFASHHDDETITNFAEVFQFAKRTSGDLIHVMEHTMMLMREKNEIEKEIEVMIASKRMEQRVMNVLPVFMLLYLRVAAADYLSDMYHNWIGIGVMTVCLLIYIGALMLSQKMMRIRF